MTLLAEDVSISDTMALVGQVLSEAAMRSQPITAPLCAFHSYLYRDNRSINKCQVLKCTLEWKKEVLGLKLCPPPRHRFDRVGGLYSAPSPDR